MLFASTLASSVGTLLAAIALAIDVKQRTNSGLWVGAVLIVDFLPTVLVGLTLGPLLDRLERRKLMIASDLLRAAVFAALPFATNAATIVALALVAGLGPASSVPPSTPGSPISFRMCCSRTRTRFCRVSRTQPGRSARSLGGVITAAVGARIWRTGSTQASFLISAVFVARIPARMLQSTALTRGHWTDLKEGFATVFHSRRCSRCSSAGASRNRQRADNVSEVFLAKNTLHSGDFGYGLIYGAIGVGLVIGGFFSSMIIERLGVARTYGLGIGADGDRLRRRRGERRHLDVRGVLRGHRCGNGIAVVCNAMLVQRTPDAVRGRALTFVMSATWRGWLRRSSSRAR